MNMMPMPNIEDLGNVVGTKVGRSDNFLVYNRSKGKFVFREVSNILGVTGEEDNILSKQGLRIALDDLVANLSLGDLNDVTISDPQENKILQYDGDEWVESTTIANFTISTNTLIADYLTIDSANSSIYNMNFKLDGANDFIGTHSFASGSGGYGWRIEGDGKATFQDIYARGTLAATVFLKKTISAVGGEFWIADATKLSETPTGVIIYTQDECFDVDDHVIMRRWTGSEVVEFKAQIETDHGYNDEFDAYKYTLKNTSGDITNFYAGNAIVQDDMKIILAASGYTNEPFIDIIATYGGDVSARLGNLAGITDADFGGALSGYGLYSTNIYLKGNIIATSGTIGGFTINATEGLYAGTGNTRVQMKAGVGFWCGATAFGSAPFRVSQAGLLTASGATISGSITATSGTVGGFTVNATNGLYAGTGVTRVQMKPGAGFWAGATAFGDAPFSVTQAGVLVATNATITGILTANTGYIGGSSGWTISTKTLTGAVDSVITGGIIQTAASGQRIVLNESGNTNSLKFYGASGLVITIDDNIYGGFAGMAFANGVISNVVTSHTTNIMRVASLGDYLVGSDDTSSFYASAALSTGTITGAHDWNGFRTFISNPTAETLVTYKAFSARIHEVNTTTPVYGFIAEKVVNTGTGDAFGLKILNDLASTGGTAYPIHSEATQESYLAGDLSLASGKKLIFSGYGGNSYFTFASSQIQTHLLGTKVGGWNASGLFVESGKYIALAGSNYRFVYDSNAIKTYIGGAVKSILSASQLYIDGLVIATGFRSAVDPGGEAGTITITGVADTPTAALDWSTVGAPDMYLKGYYGNQAIVIAAWNT